MGGPHERDPRPQDEERGEVMTLPKHIEELLDSVEMPERSPILVHPDEHERMIRAEERAATEREVADRLRSQNIPIALMSRDGDNYYAAVDLASWIERGEYRKGGKR